MTQIAEIILTDTIRPSGDESLDIERVSLEHLLAQAIGRLHADFS